MSVKKENFWTEEKLERVRVLRREGRSFGQIASYIGSTRSAVLSVWYRRILQVVHPSSLPMSQRVDAKEKQERRTIPTLCYVPGLTANAKYVMVTHDQR